MSYNKRKQKCKSLVKAFICAVALSTVTSCDENAPKELSVAEKQSHALEIKITKNDPIYRRHLTSGEKHILKNMLGDKLNLENIEFLFYEQSHTQLSSNVLPNDTDYIRVYGEKHMSNDYSQEDDAFLYGALIYEATTLAQHQNGETWKHSRNDSTHYQLYENHTNRLDFEDYGAKHQAGMLGDYARKFFHKTHSSHIMMEGYGKNNCRALDTLSSIVEKKFPRTKELRDHLSGREIRALTENEHSLTLGIFGRNINMTDLSIHLEMIDCVDRKASVGNQKYITFWGQDHHSDDYVTDADTDNFGTYIHESTHIWQRHNGFKYTNLRQESSYTYVLNPSRWSFRNYGTEQQASIIEDYAHFFLHSNKKGRRNWSEKGKEMIKTIVEEQFPQAKITREYFEKYKILPRYSSIKKIPQQAVLRKAFL